MPQISCNNLTLGYDGKTVLNDLSFSVECGEYLCIIGENGSGKSTLLKTMLQLHAPLTGSIMIGEGTSRYEIGYLPQHSIVQKDFPASVFEIVLSGCLNRCGLRPYYRQKEKQLARESLEKLGISHLSKRCYRDLSGGQQQRVLLARALCATGKILLLDEPVSALDPKGSAEMYEIIHQLNKDGITIIMVSHDIREAVQYATHILYLGETQFFGTRTEYLASGIGSRFSASKGES